jgi:hypothetical protein
MLYELRIYQAVPGQMPRLLARFRDQTVPIWEKHGIHPIGFWTTLIGESSNELTYILLWASLADRETKWTAFQNDLAWQKPATTASAMDPSLRASTTRSSRRRASQR